MKEKKKRESRKDQKEDIKKIISIGRQIDYSDRDKVRSLCGWLLKNPEFFSTSVGRRYTKELRKSALNLDEDFRCVLCGKRVERDFYFCSGCFQKAILNHISIKKRRISGTNRKYTGRAVSVYLKGLLCVLLISVLGFGIHSVMLRVRTVPGPQMIVSEEAAKAAAVEQMTLSGQEFYLEEREEQKKWRILKVHREEQIAVFRNMMEELYKQGNSIEEALEISSKNMRNRYPVLLYTTKLEDLTAEEINAVYEKLTGKEQQPQKKEQKLEENQKVRMQSFTRPVMERGELWEIPENDQDFELG